MYILLVSRGIPSTKDPQWGCFEFDQAQALKSLGHKVVILSVDERIRFYRRKLGITHTVIDGIECYNLRFIPKKISNLLGSCISSKISRAQYDYLFNHIISKEGLPDIIYSHYLNISYNAVSLKIKYNLPLVAIEHWSEINKDILIPKVLKLGNSTYHYVDQLICVSESLKQMVKKHFNQDSIVVHNMIAKSFCNPNFDSITNKKIQFVATGSLVYRKGFDLLPKAFSMLNLPNEQWELTIIGEGNEYGNLTQQIHSTSLQNNIHLVGIKTKEQIAEILKNSSIFLLPSRNENFSVAVLEALACGLPVIASICGGIRECINETNGLLFPVDDVEKLAQSILYAVQHIDKYDRKAIAEDCLARFSPEVIAEQLTQIFEETIKKTKNN